MDKINFLISLKTVAEEQSCLSNLAQQGMRNQTYLLEKKGSENTFNIFKDIFRFKKQVNMQYSLNIKTSKI